MESIIEFGIYFIRILSRVLQWCMFIWIILGWFSAQKNNLGIMLDQIILPLLRPFAWARIGMISLAPIIVFLLINALEVWIVTELTKLL